MGRTQFRQEQAELVRIFGQRMKEARGLCNLSVSKAADRLGYSNPSKLSKVENASDTNSVPLWLIVRASKLYDVSIDFLMGISDDWERDPVVAQERNIAQWMYDAWEKERAKETNTFRQLHNQIVTLAATVSAMMETVDTAHHALERVIQLNPEAWEDIRGGTRLEEALSRAKHAVRCGRAGLKRFKVEIGMEKAREATQEDQDAEILEKTVKRLAALPALEYEQVRRDEATKLGIRVTALDRAVESHRPVPVDGYEMRFRERQMMLEGFG